jgi:hypothetical protein
VLSVLSILDTGELKNEKGHVTHHLIGNLILMKKRGQNNSQSPKTEYGFQIQNDSAINASVSSLFPTKNVILLDLIAFCRTKLHFVRLKISDLISKMWTKNEFFSLKMQEKKNWKRKIYILPALLKNVAIFLLITSYLPLNITQILYKFILLSFTTKYDQIITCNFYYHNFNF